MVLRVGIIDAKADQILGLIQLQQILNCCWNGVTQAVPGTVIAGAGTTSLLMDISKVLLPKLELMKLE